MSIVIVPNIVREAIDAKIDKQLLLQPSLKKHRKEIFQELLEYFDEHGEIPDFTLREVE